MAIVDTLVRQRLDELISQGQQVLNTRHGTGWVDGALAQQWRTSCRNFLSRVVGIHSVYFRDFDRTEGFHEDKIKQALAVMKAVKEDIEAGFLFERDELLKAEVLEDLFDQAQHLLDHGYAQPAASLAGAVL